LISHRDLVETDKRFEAALFRGLAQHVDLHFADWEDGGADRTIGEYAAMIGRDLKDFDVCIIFVRFRLRRDGPPLHWDGFAGLRIWLEPDAWGGFDESNTYFGSYAPVFGRDHFDLLVSSGHEVTRRLNDAGVNACWLPKGYDEKVFFDLGAERHGVCTFGTQWPSRRALLHHLSRAGLEVVNVSGPYTSLNERLNLFAGGLVCNMMSSIPLGRAGRLLNRWFPTLVTVTPGIEPMAKTFEVAGAGCAPIVDAIDELHELGFVAGQTCLTYRDFKGAEEVLRSADDAELLAIGSRAMETARTRHTWAHRAEQLADIIVDTLAGRA
jgi:hypothetical protein